MEEVFVGKEVRGEREAIKEEVRILQGKRTAIEQPGGRAPFGR